MAASAFARAWIFNHRVSYKWIGPRNLAYSGDDVREAGDEAGQLRDWPHKNALALVPLVYQELFSNNLAPYFNFGPLGQLEQLLLKLENSQSV